MNNLTNKYGSFQEGAKRLQAATSGVPDRIPVYAAMHDFARHEFKLSSKDFYFEPDVFVPAVLDTHLKYGIDAATIGYDTYNIEAGALGQEIAFNEDSVPSAKAPIINTPDDLKKIKTPDFSSDGRFPFVNGINTLFQELTGLAPVIKYCAPFSLAANLRGIENLIMDMCTNPDFASELLTTLTEDVIAPWICYQQKLFPDAKSICGADAYASPPILSPSFLVEWALPYIVRLRELCGEGVYVPNWVGDSCFDNPEEMFSYKLKACPKFLEGQDPDVEKIGPEKYKEYAEKHNVPLVLGIGSKFLAQASRKEVVDRVQNYIDIGGRGGRFVLYLCGLTKTTPPENIRAVIKTITEYSSER